MLMTYTNLSTKDLQGSTLADYVIAIDADFQILDGDRIVYEEPYFPVVELARSLMFWVEDRREEEFVFESLSFDEPGAVLVSPTQHGWVFRSRFTPEVSSSPASWTKIQECVESFAAKVRIDLVRSGIDAELIFRR